MVEEGMIYYEIKEVSAIGLSEKTRWAVVLLIDDTRYRYGRNENEIREIALGLPKNYVNIEEEQGFI